MKICKYCNNENNEEFIFCSYCGKRIDGKKECPKCNNLLDENAKFCGFCGTRVDNKKECQNCHQEIEANLDFCSFCGSKTKAKIHQPKRVQNNVFNLISKIILLSLSCLFIVGVFLSFMTATYISSNIVNEKLYIYDFFTKDFFDLLLTRDKVIGTGYESSFVISYNMRIIILMVTTYLGIIATLTTSIISIIKNAISIANKNELPSYKIAISSGLCYFALTFGMIQSFTGLYSYENYIDFSLSAMPITMLIISILSIITITTFNIIQNKLSVKKYISLGLRSLSFILSLITIFLICGNVITIETASSTSTSVGTTYSILFAFILLLSNEGAVIPLILLIIAILITLYAIFGTFTKVYKLTEKYSVKGLVSSVINSGLIIILFILTITLTQAAFASMENQVDNMVSISSGLVVALIFTIISLGLDISSFVLTIEE